MLKRVAIAVRCKRRWGFNSPRQSPPPGGPIRAEVDTYGDWDPSESIVEADDDGQH